MLGAGKRKKGNISCKRVLAPSRLQTRLTKRNIHARVVHVSERCKNKFVLKYRKRHFCTFQKLVENQETTQATNHGEYWIWPGCNAITHFNHCIPKKLNTSANEVKRKATCKCAREARKILSQKTPQGKKDRESGAVPARTLNKLLKTATDKSRTSNKTITRVYWKIY